MRQLLFVFAILPLTVAVACGDEQDDGLVEYEDECEGDPFRSDTYPPLYINEFLAYAGTDHGTGEQHPDWLEIYNCGPEAVSMQGVMLWSEDGGIGGAQEPWYFPIDVQMEPYDYLLVTCDQGDTDAEGLHANFRLERNSGTIHLYSDSYTSEEYTDIDYVGYGYQEAGWSSARVPDGGMTWTVLQEPTPGAMNQ